MQYAATPYVSCLWDHGSQISIATSGQPTQNAFAERLMRILKEEEVYLHEYRNYAEAREQIAHSLEDVYIPYDFTRP